MKFEKKLLVLALMGLPVASAFADGVLSTTESDVKSAGTTVVNGVESAGTTVVNGVETAGTTVENGAKDAMGDVDNFLTRYHGPFTGAYVGAKAGVNDSNMGVGNPRALTGGATPGIPNNQNYGTALGLEAGYGWALGRTVLGIDAGYGYNGTGRSGYFSGNQGYGSHDYGLGLKFGIPVTDKLMPYAKLGYGHLVGTGSASGLSGNGANGGLGVEYLFAPHWSVAGEWNTMSVSNNSNTMNNNVYTLGVNYYFGAAKPPRHVAAAAPAPVVAPAPEPVVAPAPTPQERWRIITEEKPVSLDGANFKFNSAVLNKTADEKLTQVVDFSKQYPEADINVDGYTDNIGPKAYNVKLSQRRADAVKAYLVKHGVAADRIHTKGYGMENPVASNKTAEGRAQNRHVEVHYTVREEKKVHVMQ
jgi:OOP family OmpA-OmpF porin